MDWSLMYSSLPVFLISLTIEVIKLIIIMSGIFSFSFSKAKRSYAFFLGSAFLLTLILHSFNFMNPFSLPVSAMILSAFLISEKNKYIFLVLSEISASCVDEGVNYFIEKTYLSSNGNYYIVSNSVGIVIFSLVAYIVQSRRKRGLDYSLKKYNVFYLMMLALGQFVIAYYMSELQGQRGFNKLLVCIIITAVLVVELVMVYSINRRDYYYNMSMVNQQMLDNQEKYYSTLLNHENEIRSFRHDVKNHFVCLEALINEGKITEASEYISGLKGSFALSRSEIRTGNTIVNAIASDYASRFPVVELEWDGLIPDELKISRVDVCTIFSNVLSNAFENAVKSETEKKVKVMIHTVNNSMIITVRNNVGSRAVEKDGMFETSKEDKANHGLGTQNIRSCVKSNGGEIDFKFDEKMFEVKIILPNALQVF